MANQAASNGAGAVGDLLSGIGNFISDQGQAKAFGYEAEGDAAEATAYGQASTYALQNAQISAQSTKLQKYQVHRQVFQNIGAGRAAAGASGLTEGGSAKDILRSSAQQGALVSQVIGEQGAINETAYQEQAAQYTGMQKAALAAQSAAKAQQSAMAGKGTTDLLSGVASAAAMLFML